MIKSQGAKYRPVGKSEGVKEKLGILKKALRRGGGIKSNVPYILKQGTTGAILW